MLSYNQLALKPLEAWLRFQPPPPASQQLDYCPEIRGTRRGKISGFGNHEMALFEDGSLVVLNARFTTRNHFVILFVHGYILSIDS